MKTRKGLLHILVREALEFSNTSPETLATACDIPFPRIKSFLAGNGSLSENQWKVVKGALGITVPLGRPGTKHPA